MKRQRGKVWVIARCNTRCSHRLSWSTQGIRAPKKAVRRARAATTPVAAGVPVKLAFRLDRRARVAIAASHKRGRKVAATLTVATSHAGGGTSKRQWRVVLKP